MPNGSVVEGAQGNFPFEKGKAWYFPKRLANSDDARKADADLRHLDHSLFTAPWQEPDPNFRWPDYASNGQIMVQLTK
jgi:hypothetical protein